MVWGNFFGKNLLDLGGSRPLPGWFGALFRRRSAPECLFECREGGAKVIRAMPKCPLHEFQGGFPYIVYAFFNSRWSMLVLAIQWALDPGHTTLRTSYWSLKMDFGLGTRRERDWGWPLRSNTSRTQPHHGRGSSGTLFRFDRDLFKTVKMQMMAAKYLMLLSYIMQESIIHLKGWNCETAF